MSSQEPYTEPAGLLSSEQVAQLCGLSRRAVYDAIKRGELPAVRLCSRLRVRRDDLERWFATSSVRPTTPASARPPKPRSKPAPSDSFRAQLRTNGKARQ